MKMKHNKKRNTAFLYEILMKEYVKAVVKKDNKTKEKSIKILKEFFSNDRILKKELELYKTVLETKNLNDEKSIRLLFEIKKDFNLMDKKEVFNAQTKLIKTINESLSNKIFANFISNYKNIATVGQYFNSGNSAKQRILLEDKVKFLMMSKDFEQGPMQHIDNLTYNTFVNKFNETYKNSLREEQKNLLTNYIVSFSDNGLGLKIFMNEEIGRLKQLVTENIKNGKYPDRLDKILEKLESFKKVPVTEEIVKEVFYIQDLVYEVQKS